MASTEQAGLDLNRRPWEGLPPDLAELLRPGIAGLSGQIIEAIRTSLPPYRRPLTGDFGHSVRVGVERALEQFVEMVEHPPQGELPHRATYVALGRGEAREGRTLETLLAAYRIGARLAWRRVAGAARDTELDSDTLALLAEAIFAYIDELSACSAEGYAEERSAVAEEAERRRRTLVSLVTQSPPPDAAAVEGAAREAEWRIPAELAVVVWRGGPVPQLPPGTIAAATDVGDTLALVPDPAAPGRRAELRRALAGRHAALGPTVPWREGWRSARRARAAWRLVDDGVLPAGELAAADEHLASLLLHADSALHQELAERALAPLSHRPPAARARLADTLRALIDHQGSAPEAANALHVHPQTVRYRLAQLREDFGAALDDPETRFELSLALRASRGPAAPAGAPPT